jgi:hypothetical protein
MVAQSEREAIRFVGEGVRDTISHYHERPAQSSSLPSSGSHWSGSRDILQNKPNDYFCFAFVSLHSLHLILKRYTEIDVFDSYSQYRRTRTYGAKLRAS